ncbi:MAG: Bax inhibitor-1/YccA family protein [Alphaproteobacteria bacterium]|nr:Bax inhibitor-1/YccA family protein [Alphaproteobacteria bacterium]
MSNTNMFSQSFSGAGNKVDSGLRNFMISVYNLMSAGLSVTAISSFACLNIPFIQVLFFDIAPNGMVYNMTSLGWIAFLAPFFVGMYLSAGIGSLNIASAQVLFFVYASLTGIGLAPMVSLYTSASVAKAFLVTAALFGTMSIYGQTTKANLASWGTLLYSGLIAIICASLFNLFIGSPVTDYVLSVLSIVVFLGLTSYHNQKLKDIYYYSGRGDLGQKYAVLGAFTLYLDFINLFVHILRLMGSRKE